MEKLRPVCRFDPEKPEMYRNSRLLRDVLTAAIPSLIPPGDAAEESYGY
jgi:hypothetical protein